MCFSDHFYAWVNDCVVCLFNMQYTCVVPPSVPEIAGQIYLSIIVSSPFSEKLRAAYSGFPFLTFYESWEVHFTLLKEWLQKAT